MLGRKIIVSINHGRDGSLFSFNYGPKNDTKSGFGVYEIKTQQLVAVESEKIHEYDLKTPKKKAHIGHLTLTAAEITANLSKLRKVAKPEQEQTKDR